MDESVRMLGKMRSGRIEGKVWKTSRYTDDGYPDGCDYELELSNGPPVGNVVMNLLETPDLVKVIVDGITIIQDQLDDDLKEDLVKLSTALWDAASSRNL